MVSVHYEEMLDELEDLKKRYYSLMTEFRQTGDFEIFVELDEALLSLFDQAYLLDDKEEQIEIYNEITAIRSSIDCLTHSAF